MDCVNSVFCFPSTSAQLNTIHNDKRERRGRRVENEGRMAEGQFYRSHSPACYRSRLTF